MDSTGKRFDVAIVGGGLAGVMALASARKAGLEAVVLERQGRVGGLWRDLPAWQDIQISAADWALGDVPLQGVTQPHILANLEAWVERFGLADGIRLNTPVQSAREDTSGWELATPKGLVHARHLVAATGAHNTPVIPACSRTASAVREFHSSTLRDPSLLTGRSVLVVGGGASAFDLLELCFQHGAQRVVWAFRGTRWFVPTFKPKHIAGSVRGFARLQASGMTAAQQSATIGADMRARYDKFGLTDLLPAHDFDVRHDQLIPGRPGMLQNFADIERHRASVSAITGGTEHGLLERLGVDSADWLFNRVGTIHTFQGKEAEAVIAVLGAPMTAQQGARRWAACTPNIFNVMVSRAKQTLYVVGSRAAWSTVGHGRAVAESVRSH